MPSAGPSLLLVVHRYTTAVAAAAAAADAAALLVAHARYLTVAPTAPVHHTKCHLAPPRMLLEASYFQRIGQLCP
jgi:hypothetical protein